MPDVVIHDLDVLLTMDASCGEGPLGEIRDAAVHLRDGRVVWVGPTHEAPDVPDAIDGRGCVGLPALVDCHTHAVWAGGRASEFEARLAGAEYSAILEAGGGILSTVRATRACADEELVRLAAERLGRMAARGVGTVEVKSGYGLSPEHEVRLLQAARRAGERAGVHVRTTFLGAHAVPAEWRPDREGYVAHVVHEQLPLAAPHADFVDVYVDRGAFTLDEGQQVLAAGRALGLGVRVHAEQIAHTGAAAMAARLGALSADHLERVDADGIAAMADAGTVAVMLPGSMIYLRDIAPPVDALREAGVALAVATDLNPGTSPVDDLWACATLAAVTLRMTVAEVLRGVTCVAADALGEPDRGRVRPGAWGPVVLARPAPGEPASAATLVQHLGAPRIHRIVG